MLELTPANAADYLRRQGWIGTGPVDVEPLGGGVSNAVLRDPHAGARFRLEAVPAAAADARRLVQRP